MGNQVLVAIKDSAINEVIKKGAQYLYDIIDARYHNENPEYTNGVYVSHYCHASDNALHIIDGNYGVRNTNTHFNFFEIWDRESRAIFDNSQLLKTFNKSLRVISDLSVRKTNSGVNNFNPEGEKYHVFGILTDCMHTLWSNDHALRYMIDCVKNKITGYDSDYHLNGLEYVGSYHHNQGVAVLMAGNCFLPFLQFTTKSGMKLTSWESYTQEGYYIPYEEMKKFSLESVNQLLFSYGYKATEEAKIKTA